MTERDFYEALITASSISEIDTAIKIYESARHTRVSWVPFGNRLNNRGAIEIATDPGRSLVERLTNGIDAILEAEYELHGGIPICHSPKEAATAWLDVPAAGLSELSPTRRRVLAQRIKVQVQAGEGPESRVVIIRDYGIGLTPDQMPQTILSLNESNKWQKYYLAGTYGQGGSSTLACSKYTIIASRHDNFPTVGFTVVRYLDLPAEIYKTGHYVYLTVDSSVIETKLSLDEFLAGTMVMHLGYDLTQYKSPVGPNSVYGLLNQVLFDPILPIWFDNQVHDYRRVIKGSRNALNGAVDEGDEERRGPTLSHHIRMFHVTLGEFGRIGIEYWVLDQPRENKNPIAAFVNPVKPIILTSNGQNHAELHRDLIKKDADLPYLIKRVICHIDCNSLTPTAKRMLFASTREDVRRGIVFDLIQEEIVKALKSDDELTRLNNEARQQTIEERDETALFEMRREVARLLRLQGVVISETLGGTVSTRATLWVEGTSHPRRPTSIPPPLELHDPPTYIRILWKTEESISFYPEQRRYIRIETDAPSHYHNPNDPTISRINLMATDDHIIFCGSTPLQGGRMRAIFEATNSSQIGATGRIRVELIRPGLPLLSDERPYLVIQKPPSQPAAQPLTLPLFEMQSVEGLDDPLWNTLDWPDDINAVASEAIEERDKLVIYYSRVFPKFASQRTTFEHRNVIDATSFIKRYEIWLAVHSLILHAQKKTRETTAIDEQITTLNEAYERQERCRIATLACLFAAREVQMGLQTLESLP
jgi:hypothetical protein